MCAVAPLPAAAVALQVLCFSLLPASASGLDDAAEAVALCESKCAASGYCCKGLVASHDNPSCAMGCRFGGGGGNQTCLDECAAAERTRCSGTIGGLTIRKCVDCPASCNSSEKGQCAVGCRFAAGGTLAPTPPPTAAPTFPREWLLRHPVTRVHCNTTKGVIDIDVHPEWAPIGAEHFLRLVRAGYWNDVGFVRVNGDIIQFGEQKLPVAELAQKTLKDDPKPTHQKANKMALRRGELSYAGGGKNTRGSSIFFVTRANKFLGRDAWEVPFAEVVPPGMDVVDAIYSGYGDVAYFRCKTCNGPDVQRVFQEGNAYLRKDFPLLDYMLSCDVVPATHMDDAGETLPPAVPRHDFEITVSINHIICIVVVSLGLALYIAVANMRRVHLWLPRCLRTRNRRKR